MYCTTDLCVTVNRLKKEKKKRTMLVFKMSVSTLCTFCQLLKLRILTAGVVCGATCTREQCVPITGTTHDTLLRAWSCAQSLTVQTSMGCISSWIGNF